MNKQLQIRLTADHISFVDVLNHHNNGELLERDCNNYVQNTIDLVISYDDRNQYITQIISDTSCRNEYGSLWSNYDHTMWSLSGLEWANKLGLQDLVDSTRILNECHELEYVL